MNAPDLAAVRQLEDDQVKWFRRFMAYPEERPAIIDRLIAIKARIDQIRHVEPLVVAAQEPRKHKVSRSSSPARTAYFQAGRS